MGIKVMEKFKSDLSTEILSNWHSNNSRSFESPESRAKKDVREISEKYEQEIYEIMIKVIENASLVEAKFQIIKS